MASSLRPSKNRYGSILMEISFEWLGEQHFYIAFQVCNGVKDPGGVVGSLGDDKRSLQHSLRMACKAFGVPVGLRRITLTGFFNRADQCLGMRLNARIAGCTQNGMTGKRFLNQRAQQTGELRQVSVHEPGAKIQ